MDAETDVVISSGAPVLTEEDRARKERIARIMPEGFRLTRRQIEMIRRILSSAS